MSFTHDPQAEKTTSAAATGGVAGAAADTGFMSIVGLTPLLMNAPLVVATGAALGAGVSALASGLADFGIPSARMDYYQQRLAAGDFLIAVRSDDEKELERARSVFAESGAPDSELFRLTKKLG